MSQSWYEEFDEIEDKEEYIEVKDNKQIKAILKAEEEEKAKAQE